MAFRSPWRTFSDYYDLKNGFADLIFASTLLSVIGGAVGMGGALIALSTSEDEAKQGQAVSMAQVARYDRDLSVIKSFKENSKKLESDMGAALATQNATGLPEEARAKGADAYKSLMSSWTSQQDQATKMTGNLYTRLILDDEISEDQFRTLIHTAKDTLAEKPPAVSFIKLRECQVEFATVALPDDQKAAQVAACSVDKKELNLFAFPAGGAGSVAGAFLLAPFWSAARRRREEKAEQKAAKTMNIEITLKPKK